MVAAVAGAITTASAHRASSVWGLTPSSSKRSWTGWVPVMAASVWGPRNSGRGFGHHRSHDGPALDQASGEVGSLVGSDSSGDAENDASSGEHRLLVAGER